MDRRSAQNVMNLPGTGLNSFSAPPSVVAPRKILLDRTKVQLEMEKACPKEFPLHSEAELRAILDEENREWQKIDGELMAEREVWFEEFQQDLKNKGLINDLIKDPGEHRLPRLRYCEEWINLLAERLPKYEIPLTRDEFDRQHRSVAQDPSLPSRSTILRGCKIYFSDGELALCWMPHAIDECYRGVPDHKPLEPQLREWDEELEREYPSHDPRKNDGRHPSDGYHRAQMAYLDSKRLGHGAGHFGLWHARGQQSNQTSKSNGPYCHILSEDTRGGPQTLPERVREVRRAAFKKYQLRLIPVEEALGIFYKVLAPEKFAKSREQREFIVAEFTKYGLESLPQLSEYQCHLFMARVKNKSVTNHKDEEDFGLAVETTFGDFAGGDFCCSELNERFYFRAGDFLVMDAKVLAHCVAHFDGERTTIVFTSKSSSETRKPHVNYMDDGPERDAILAEKVAKDAAAAGTHETEQQLELELILRYFGDKARIEEGVLVIDKPEFPSTEEDYKLAYIHLDAKRLEKAKGLKKKAYKAAESEDEAEEIDATPASLYYNLASQEIRRFGKGLNPFLSLVKQKKEHEARKEGETASEKTENGQAKGGLKRKRS